MKKVKIFSAIFLSISCLFSFLLFSGCATKGLVREEIARLEGRITTNENNISEMVTTCDRAVDEINEVKKYVGYNPQEERSLNNRIEALNRKLYYAEKSFEENTDILSKFVGFDPNIWDSNQETSLNSRIANVEKKTEEVKAKMKKTISREELTTAVGSVMNFTEKSISYLDPKRVIIRVPFSINRYSIDPNIQEEIKRALTARLPNGKVLGEDYFIDYIGGSYGPGGSRTYNEKLAGKRALEVFNHTTKKYPSVSIASSVKDLVEEAKKDPAKLSAGLVGQNVIMIFQAKPSSSAIPQATIAPSTTTASDPNDPTI